MDVIYNPEEIAATHLRSGECKRFNPPVTMNLAQYYYLHNWAKFTEYMESYIKQFNELER